MIAITNFSHLVVDFFLFVSFISWFWFWFGIFLLFPAESCLSDKDIGVVRAFPCFAKCRMRVVGLQAEQFCPIPLLFPCYQIFDSTYSNS